ncbi:MAG: hypothetical protein EA406_12485 [Rhodospirillales bacterium]|nr:MAG: hypothetical protein EA406_12485 [Rhodospirillales bacterium]
MKQDKPDADRRRALRWAFILTPAALLAGMGAARAQYVVYDACPYGCGAASVNGMARRTARRTSRRHAAVR